MTQLTTPTSLALTIEDETALTDLYVRGTPENTLRAYERDLLYITAWKQAAFNAPLSWPETEETALRFILDHSRALDTADNAQAVALTLINAKLRKTLNCPAPSTLDRRIASWLAFHRMRNLPSPFEAPIIRQARAKARRAAARPKSPKSEHPITREILEAMLETCGPSFRGLRDRAILLLGWASGGRRRSEITGLMREDISLAEFETKGLIWITMLETKTTQKGQTPRLVLKGRPANMLYEWIKAADITDGPLFRPISKSDSVLERKLNPDSIRSIVKHRLVLAGYPETYASPHGLRSGFLTEAALTGIPIQAAMRLSLHKSIAQAQKYYDDVDIQDNPATYLLD